MILKLRAALGNPTFPVSQRVFRVQEVLSAAILAFSMLHGTRWVQQDTFLKIYLLQMNHHQHSLEVPRMWRQLLADLYLWIQEELLSELVCSKETLRIVQYRHQDLSGSFELGILPLTQNEFIFKVVRLNCPGIKFQTCISINSLTLLDSSVGRRSSRPKYALVQGISLTRCCGSKKKRWPNQWTISRRRSQLEGLCSRIFEVLDAKTASALKRIISKPFFNRRLSLEEQKAQTQDRFLRRRQIAYMINEHFRATGAHDAFVSILQIF